MSVSSDEVQASFAATLVDEWVAAGVTHAVLCPGSRSTPLALALAERDEVALHVRLDERGACFFALGIARASGMPAVVCTTSGTAAAELAPGVAEASHDRVPLIVCTADRPPRLHHVGAPQTIEQAHLFAPFVRRAFDPGVATAGDRGWWRSLGAAVVAEAFEGTGPVHLNLAFEEPLVGEPGQLPPRTAQPVPARRLRLAGAADVAGEWWARPGVILAGAGAPGAEVVCRLADRLGWPVLADPRSGARVEHPSVVAAADAILRSAEVRAALAPETVLVFGRPWASRVVAEFVEATGRHGGTVVAVGETLEDPGRVVQALHRVDPASFANALAETVGPAPGSFRQRWERAEAAAQGAIDKTLESDALSAGGRATEPGVARHLLAALDPASLLFVSSSMPVRDLEWFGAQRPQPPRVLANRGVSGIDGVLSSALGAASAGRGDVVALVGDLAFLHDASALAELSRRPVGSCTFVVLDNRGGGIFSFLPQARAIPPDRFELLFGTAPQVSVAAVGSGFGLPVEQVATLGELDRALGRFVGREHRALVVVEVPEREQNRLLHDRLHAAVAEAVGAVLDW